MNNPTFPSEIPVFPLTGVLLLPGMLLPLNIFEPRYRNLVEDALDHNQLMGMIQPMVPRQDNQPPPGAEMESPELYSIGCLGRLEQWEKFPDGRFLIHLRGLIRFRVTGEGPLTNGYRMVQADYGGFETDPGEMEETPDTKPLVEAFRAFAEGKGLQVNTREFSGMPGPAFVNFMAMSLPFSPMEKQALLEAANLSERIERLMDLLRLGSLVDSNHQHIPPEVN